jgi:aryl-alcohol dehydrogenase-like predicted oxidoreductase
LRYRKLGRTGLEVSEIGFGGWGIGGKQWLGGSDVESLQALRRSFELGLTLVDTALAYGDGHSETLIGQAVREFGKPILIATKVPPMNRIWPAPADARIEDVFPAGYVIHQTETSLKNLGVERIDLQQLHVWNPAWTNQDEWRRAFEQLKTAGKVRLVGVSLSEHDPDSGLELVETGLVDALQVIYNIFDPTPADRLFPLAQARGTGILVRVPLDEGGLSGAITEKTVFEKDDFRATYFKGDRKKQVVEHVRRLQQDLPDASENLANIAIRFCLSHPAVSTVIPGMRRTKHVESNIKASDAGPLPPETLSVLKRHAWLRNFYNAHP